jgi:archaellum biogenesis ATPase FlaH
MFKKAETKAIKLTLGVIGPSGAGKTLSSLKMARGLVGENGKIAFIGTEGGKEQLYTNHIKNGFDTLTISAPYTIEKLQDALTGAVEGGYDIVVIDSLSHFWSGDGGALSQVDEIASVNNGNSSAGWNIVTKKIDKLINRITTFPIHLILTVRSEIVYDYSKEPGQKMKVTKLGLTPVWRSGKQCITYELDNVMTISSEHIAKVSKTRLFDMADKIFNRPDEKIGAMIGEIVNTGNYLAKPIGEAVEKQVEPDLIPTEEESVAVTEKQRSLTKLEDLAIKTGRDTGTWFAQLATHFGKKVITEVPNTKLKEVIDKVTGDLAKKQTV